MRMDYEAMLAYLLLPPAGGVFLLLVEHKSDYVRYVACRNASFSSSPVAHKCNTDSLIDIDSTPGNRAYYLHLYLYGILTPYVCLFV